MLHVGKYGARRRGVEMDGHNNQPSDGTALEYRSATPDCKGYLHAELLVLEGEERLRIAGFAYLGILSEAQK